MLKRIIPLVLILSFLLLFGCQSKTVSKNGTYEIEVALEGGTGKASIQSPTLIYIVNDEMTARIEWSSPNYDYMIVDGEKYEPEIVDGHSVFNIPVKALDEKLNITADTIAMSVPHEIEYTLYFDSAAMHSLH